MLMNHCTNFRFYSYFRSLLILVSNFAAKFVKCQMNMVTHTLATETYYTSRPSRCIFESISPCMDNYLINEMS
jgi:hypothetical protein